jgi:hypothetical protein
VVLVGLGMLEGADDAFGRVAGWRLLLCHFGWACVVGWRVRVVRVVVSGRKSSLGE